MMRRPMALAGVILLALSTWALLRPETSVHASDDTPVTTEVHVVDTDYAVNDEETASRRWASSQATHWRHLMVAR